MRGLYISFVIKRRKKLDKIMDFFLVIAIFIFVFTFLFYVQYVNRENKYNSTDKELQTQNVEAKKLTEQLEQKNKENSSDIEINYNKAYTELAAYVDGVAKYTGYVQDIYEAVIPGVTINGFAINSSASTITLTLEFDTTNYSTEIIFDLDELQNSKNKLNELRNTIKLNKNVQTKFSIDDVAKLTYYSIKFTSFINNNLDIPKAINLLFTMLNEMPHSEDVYELIMHFDEVLGLNLCKL